MYNKRVDMCIMQLPAKGMRIIRHYKPGAPHAGTACKNLDSFTMESFCFFYGMKKSFRNGEMNAETHIKKPVPLRGFEPPRPRRSDDFESSASAGSATGAVNYNYKFQISN